MQENRAKHLKTGKKVLIVTGGRIEEPFALEYLERQTFDYVIAADSGMEFLHCHGKVPDLIVGDFDSANADVLKDYRAREGIEWKTFRPEKDDTDTEIAVLIAADRGAEEVHILGGTGSRADHMIANVYLLGILLERGILAYLVDACNRIRLIDKRTVLKKEAQYGEYVSLIPFMGEALGVTLTGFQYPLSDAVLGGCHSLGISNEITEEQAVIEISAGRLILIESKDKE